MAKTLSNPPKDRVTINEDYFGPGDGVYIVPEGGGYSTLGFDVCIDRIDRYAIELMVDEPKVQRGTMQAYNVMRGLAEALRLRYERTGERSVAELSPQLVGLEGWRVAVERENGELDRFVVGKSTGWMPCHLELRTRISSGGVAADRSYKLVSPIERVK